MTEVVDPFWKDDIYILFKTDRIHEFFVTEDQSPDEKLNSITRFGVYVSIVLSMYHNNPKYILLSLIFFAITYFIHTNTDPVPPDPPQFVEPDLNNPFGNNVITDAPDRPPMVDYSSNNKKTMEIKNKMEESFNYNLYNDLGDLYGKTNSQRQFYTTPSRGTTPPDPDGKFKQWLYGDMPSCKDNTYNCRVYESPINKK